MQHLTNTCTIPARADIWPFMTATGRRSSSKRSPLSRTTAYTCAVYWILRIIDSSVPQPAACILVPLAVPRVSPKSW